jgi:hypothetical protein
MAKKTRETAMQALDKLENFLAKTTEILGNCSGIHNLIT